MTSSKRRDEILAILRLLANVPDLARESNRHVKAHLEEIAKAQNRLGPGGVITEVEAHIWADDLLLELLDDPAVAEAYNAVPRWFE